MTLPKTVQIAAKIAENLKNLYLGNDLYFSLFQQLNSLYEQLQKGLSYSSEQNKWKIAETSLISETSLLNEKINKRIRAVYETANFVISKVMPFAKRIKTTADRSTNDTHLINSQSRSDEIQTGSSSVSLPDLSPSSIQTFKSPSKKIIPAEKNDDESSDSLPSDFTLSL